MKQGTTPPPYNSQDRQKHHTPHRSCFIMQIYEIKFNRENDQNYGLQNENSDVFIFVKSNDNKYVKGGLMRESGSIALRVRRLLIENGVEKDLADALALAFDEVYHTQMSEVATKHDLKMLIQFLEKRFEAIDRRFEANDKRFEDINRRFEDVNKRFEDLNKRITTLQWLIFLLFTLYTGLMALFMRYLVLSVT